ncbi:hypothetical protein N752_03755 [Desulforamulus aquiferis]|nr:hypothetical protein [Desulforamulus aquiferis]RYD06451.1 hypothetical protein N752_03755 [Desulforamulus aquiferis]
MAKILNAKYMAKCIGCYSCMLACARTIRRSFSLSKSAIKIHTLVACKAVSWQISVGVVLNQPVPGPVTPVLYCPEMVGE